MEKHKGLTEQVLEVEANLDRWLAARALAAMSVLGGGELAEQDWQVQECVNIMNQVFDLRFFKDRLEARVLQNARHAQAAGLRAVLLSAAEARDRLVQELERGRELAAGGQSALRQMKAIMGLYAQNRSSSQLHSSSSNVGGH